MTNGDTVENQPSKEILTKGNLEQLLEDFSEVYKTQNLVEREYKLVHKAKQFDSSLDEYRRMFELYSEIQRQSHWTSYFKKIAQVIQAFGFIVIVITAVKFGWDTTDRHRKHLFENWDIVASSIDAKGNPIAVNRGRKEALEFLHDHDEDLSRVKAEQAVLNKVNLPGAARLQQSDFQGATLYSAYLVKANLWNANFRGANLDTANLQGATLQYADFREGADLQNACFRSAKLEHAFFDKTTNLDKADLRGATGLDPSKLQQAKNYQTAIYDQTLSSQLGLPDSNLNDSTAAGCRVAPRSRTWWNNLFK